jgi:cbb3-type cytochrome oxidase subunit 3
MGTLDIVMLVFLTLVLIGGMVGFFIYNNKEE